MSQVIIAKIKSATVSQTELTLTQGVSHLLSGGQSLINPIFLLSGLLKDYDSSKVRIKMRVFNSVEAIAKEKESKEKHNRKVKFTEIVGKLNVEHGMRDTDIDTWFESKVNVDLLEKVQRKRGMVWEASKSNFDFNEYLEDKVGKVLYLDISKL